MLRQSTEAKCKNPVSRIQQKIEIRTTSQQEKKEKGGNEQGNHQSMRHGILRQSMEALCKIH